jgi:hypothetical protein
MIDWVSELENYKIQIYRAEPEANHYYFNSQNSDTLVIVAGDSWTWGDSLDPKHRLEQVYGKLVSDHYQADWINIGCPGWSNSWILLQVLYIIKHLQNVSHYKKIYVIMTLTENGRDIATSVSHVYDYYTPYLELGQTDKFYQRILDDIEIKWSMQVQEMLDITDDRYTFFVGNNFVWHDNLPNMVSNERMTIASNNWIEKLADYQNIDRPIRTNLVTGWIFDTIDEIHSINKLSPTATFKQWCMPLIDKANLVNQWLDSSELNFDVASKHPTSLGHQVWADYIINTLNHHEQRRS